MDKLAISFSDTGVKGFVAHHIEKLIFGAAVLLFAVLFAIGYTTPSVKSDSTPKSLVQLADQAKANINQKDVWEALQKSDEKRRPSLDHVVRVEASRAPTQPTAYKAPVPLSLITDVPDIRRRDPDLLPPVEIVVKPFYGAMAMQRWRGYQDPLVLAGAVPATEEAAAPVKKAKPKRRRRGGESSEEMSMSMEDSYEEEDTTAISSAPTTRMLTPHQTAEYSNAKYFQAGASGEVAVTGVYGLAVKAVVPIADQREIYEATFSTAVGHDPQRDAPKYLNLEVQRADVTANPSAEPAEADWKLVMDSPYGQKIAALYGGIPAEQADPRYWHPRLTQPAPPLLLTDLTELQLHPKVPQRVDTLEVTDNLPSDKPEIDGPGAVPAAAASTTSNGETGGTGGAFDLLAPTSGGYNAGGAGGGVMASEGYSSGPVSSGASYGPEGGLGMPVNAEPADYKLVRIFDRFQLKPGHIYRYRMRVWLTDPNNPRLPAGAGGAAEIAGGASSGGASAGETSTGGNYGGAMQSGGETSSGNSTIVERMLEDTVIARLKKQEKEDLAKKAPTPTVYRKTAWSKPSPPVLVPRRPEILLAGQVEEGRTIRLTSTNQEIPMTGPKGKLVSVLWDNKIAVTMAAETEVERGTFLNFTHDTDVLHPQILRILRLEQRKFDPNALVLDMQGGERLPGGDRNNPLLAPGEMLMVDAMGNLRVQKETEDTEDYRKHMLIDDAPATGTGLEGGAMYPGGEMSTTESSEGGGTSLRELRKQRAASRRGGSSE